ncbi:MAG: endonuclease domain-containing protein [Devosia sp.]
MSVGRARQLRKQMSPAEARMWDYLRTLKAEGFHFRRQVPLGRYYADFACHHAKLVIEIDGDTHFTRAGINHDLERDIFLRGEGYRTIRYTNTEILQNMDGVVIHLLSRLAEFPLRPGMPGLSIETNL